MAQVRVTVDGLVYEDDVEPRMLLVSTCGNASARPAR